MNTPIEPAENEDERELVMTEAACTHKGEDFGLCLCRCEVCGLIDCLCIAQSNLDIVMERFKCDGWNLGSFLEAAKADGIEVIEVF